MASAHTVNRKDARGGANRFGLHRSLCGSAADRARRPPFRALGPSSRLFGAEKWRDSAPSPKRGVRSPPCSLRPPGRTCALRARTARPCAVLCVLGVLSRGRFGASRLHALFSVLRARKRPSPAGAWGSAPQPPITNFLISQSPNQLISQFPFVHLRGSLWSSCQPRRVNPPHPPTAPPVARLSGVLCSLFSVLCSLGAALPPLPFSVLLARQRPRVFVGKRAHSNKFSKPWSRLLKASINTPINGYSITFLLSGCKPAATRPRLPGIRPGPTPAHATCTLLSGPPTSHAHSQATPCPRLPHRGGRAPATPPTPLIRPGCPSGRP